VGGAPGKIDLYVGKEVVKRAIPMESVRRGSYMACLCPWLLGCHPQFQGLGISFFCLAGVAGVHVINEFAMWHGNS
jgi:hypothetical protein